MKQNEIQDNSVSTLNSYQFENTFNVYEADGFYFYNLLKNVSFPDNLSVGVYNVVRPFPNELLPSLSYRVYNTTSLWWVIALANNITNPLESLNPEDRLKIINTNYIQTILSKITNG